MQSLKMGHFPPGDQIPWKFCEEFEDTDFPHLSGVRIVRLAVHPSAQGQGYGSAALDLLTRYYESKLTDMGEISFEENPTNVYGSVIEAAKKVSLMDKTISPRKNLPPLLVHPHKRLPEKVDYIGASFGINADLFRFWKKHNFTPFYICDNPNNATGEHSCMMLKPLETDGVENNCLGSLGFLAPFYQCFKTKFVKRLPLCFEGLDYKLAMSILDPKIEFMKDDVSLISRKESYLLVKFICSPNELKLLEAYTNNRKDLKKVEHFLPLLAQYYFQEKRPVNLSHVEASLLLLMGLQQHDINYLQDKMKLQRQQILHVFRKVMVKFYRYLNDIFTKALDPDFPQIKMVELQPHAVTVDEDHNDGACEAMEKLKMQNTCSVISENMEGYYIKSKEATSEHALLNPEKLLSYSIEENEFEPTLQRCSKIPPSGIVSVKSVKNTPSKRKKHDASKIKNKKMKPQQM